jgi:UDP-N-acetylglucosamine--N-acetylmuramyl-(pentapeptide) pyrophosphoryl-undecaprenol N-acetylglucosamine transferase
MLFKAIIAGGGTGGHLFPAVAVGEEMSQERGDCQVLFVGASNGIEAKWLPSSGLRYELLEVRGFSGKSLPARMRAVHEFLQALRRGRKLLSGFGAEVVVGAGGYASAPMAVAAILCRTPLILMEQNTRPGLANRLMWRFARKVCVGFADTAHAFDAAKVEVTGNPVRFSKMPQAAKLHGGPLRVLVLGGSSGAHRLNVGVLSAFKILGNEMEVSIIHQTGEADQEMVAAAYRQLGRAATVVSFIDDIATALDDADLIIGRAGAMTVSEIALAGRPAIFVPYPFHRDRQQEHNARVLTRVDGAVIVPDDELLGKHLAESLRRLCARPECLLEMGHRAHQASISDAASRVAAVCFQIAEQAAAKRPNARGPAGQSWSKLAATPKRADGGPSAEVNQSLESGRRTEEDSCGLCKPGEPAA